MVSDILQALFSNEQMKYLVALIVANLILGIAASIKGRDFKLTAVADWLLGRVLPLLLGYGSAALIAWSNPEMEFIRTAAFGTLTIALLGYIMANLRDFGVPLPDLLAGKRPYAAPPLESGHRD